MLCASNHLEGIAWKMNPLSVLCCQIASKVTPSPPKISIVEAHFITPANFFRIRKTCLKKQMPYFHPLDFPNWAGFQDLFFTFHYLVGSGSGILISWYIILTKTELPYSVIPYIYYINLHKQFFFLVTSQLVVFCCSVEIIYLFLGESNNGNCMVTPLIVPL